MFVKPSSSLCNSLFLFLSKLNYGIFSRFYLVADFFSQMSFPTFMFGMGKAVQGTYMSMASNSSPGLHTGFVYFQACYGLIGSIFYASCMAMLLKDYVLIFRKKFLLGVILLACFVATLVFNLAECEVLIISGSAAIFIFNIICVVYPRGYLLHETN